MTTAIRLDGREKVTGIGRYAADLTMTGMLHGRFKFAELAPRADPPARHVEGEGAARRVRGDHRRRRARHPLRPLRQGPHDLRARRRPLGGRGRRGRRGDDPGDRPRSAIDAIEVDYEPLPFVTDIEAALEPDAPSSTRTGRATSSTSASSGRIRTRPRDRRSSRATRPPRWRAAAGRREEPLRGRWLAGRADRAARDRGRMAQRTRPDLVVDAGSVRGARARRGDARACPRTRSGSPSRTWAAASGPSARVTSSRRSRRWRGPPGRPVKVVFSRREEFLAPDHRREGMVIELETGADRDGTIVARRGRLITENGAYSADEPLITQMAVMFLAGPYRLPNIDLVGQCVYTNTQPSGSVRARVRRRRRGRSSSTWTSSRPQARHGSRGTASQEPARRRRRRPARPVHGLDPCASRRWTSAAELIGYGKAPAGRRVDRHRLRLVAVVPDGVGRLHQDQRRRLADDHHRRPGMRHGRGDDAADPRRRGPRHRSRRRSRWSTRTPRPGRGTVARAGRRRSSTTAAPTIDAAETLRDRLLDDGGRRSSRPTRPTSSWPRATSA